MIQLTAPEEMQHFAKHLARHLRPGDLILLQGPLGVGKTVFARAVIQSLLGEETAVSSPTFSLLNTYEHDFPIAHLDLYRLEHEEELNDLGIEDLLDSGVMLVEWPALLLPRLPANYLMLEISYSESDPMERNILYSGNSHLISYCKHYDN